MMAALHRQVRRSLLFLGGWIALVLAIIGTVLPIMPTVPFLLLAIACFSRSSEKMHQWILQLPGVGPELRAWEEEGAISLRAKLWASFALVVLVAIPLMLRPIAWAFKLLASLCVAGLLLFLWTRPNAKRNRD